MRHNLKNFELKLLCSLSDPQLETKEGALYEAPFSSLHAGGPDALFAGKDNVIEGLFDALEQTVPKVSVG